MGLISGIAIYFIIWWTVLFAVLPWGVRPPETIETGMDPGAPAKPRLLAKAVATTIISAIVWSVVYALVTSDLISFRDLARTL